MTENIDAMRDSILDATLPNVMFDGWTRAALLVGAEAAGHREVDVDLAFPRGPRDAIAYWFERGDRRMTEKLAAMDLAEMRIRDRIAAAVRARLEDLAPHKDSVRRALSFLARPGNADLAARGLWRAVDLMWREIGDEATDFSFYTKRVSLSAVYSSTILYWLEDESEDNNETWAFLDRRIEDAMRIPKVRANARKRRDRVIKGLKGAASACSALRRAFKPAASSAAG